jgi:gliding motility-associated-like protein
LYIGVTFGQTANNCGNYTSTGSNSSPYLPGSNTACNNNVPGTVNTSGAWTGSGCSGQIVSSVTGPAVTCLTVSYTAVNTDDYGTLTTNTGGALTITGVNVGVAGNVIGPYNCTTGYGDVMVTVCSTVPFTQLILTNTGCSSGWVINCSTVPNCLITNMTASIGACVAGAYQTTGQVEFTAPPSTGQLIVEDCDGNQQTFNAPFTSPTNYTITGQDPDGGACDITAYFTDDVACTQTIAYTAPVCVCNIDNFVVNIGACDPNTDTYMVDGLVEFTDQPTTGTLVIEVDNGTTVYDTIIFPPFNTPQNWSISGIPSDGANSSVTVYFSDDMACTNTINYTAPSTCLCEAEAGTYSNNIIGSTTTPYELCFGDQLDVIANGDYTPPQDFNIGGVTYDPGIWIAEYSCPPTVLPPGDINTDPCFVGIASTNNGAWGIPNNIGDGSTVYYVPITMYSMVDGFYAISINGGDWCYDMGPTYEVLYSPDFSSSFTEDCMAGTATATVNGALPAVDGSNFTASNLLPATAIFSNTTATDGGTIGITGLVGGDMWSFEVEDNNGCTYTVSGGPFPPLEDPGFNYTGGAWCTNDVVQTPNITGVAGGTFVSTPAGLTINAASGQITPSSSTPGIYDVTYTTPGTCFDDSTLSVEIYEVPTVTPITDETVCVGSNFTAVTITGPTTGTTFDWTNDNTNTGLAANGTGNIASFTGQTTGGTIASNIVVTPSTANCTGPTESFILTVNDLDNPSFDYTPGLTYCQTAADPVTNITGLTGGTFSYTVASGGPNLSLNTTTGDVVLATSDLGAYDITYNTATAGGSLCPNSNDDFGMPFADPGSGGTFSAVPAGLSINPNNGMVGLDASTPGTYTVTNSINVAGCPLASDFDDIIINGLPDATITGSQTICSGDPITDAVVSLVAGSNTPNWTLDYTYNGTPQAQANIAAPTTTFSISPTMVGTYDITSVTDGNGCTQSVSGQIVIDEFPTPLMDPLSPQEICEGSDLLIQTFSSTPASTYTWTNTTGNDLGFGLSGTGDIGSFTGINPGTPAIIEVTPTSNDGCIGLPVTFPVTVNPLPAVSFYADTLTGCEPFLVNFVNTSNPQGTNCLWDFGDGTGAYGCDSIQHTYMAGVFDVSLQVTTGPGCVSSTTTSSYITVNQMPEALFTYSPQEIDVENTIVEFTNHSLFATAYEWDFDDGTAISVVESPPHQFPQVPEEYLVTLWAYNGVCVDSIQQLIKVKDVLIFYVPNVMTPDGDKFNESFQPVFTSGFDPFDFHLTIFNRWGEIIFESFNAEKGWNGHYGDGGLVDDGVYVWQIEFKESMSDKRHTHRGHVTVLK